MTIGMESRPKPRPEDWAVLRLVENLIHLKADLLDHARRELGQSADGWPLRGDTAGGRTSGGTSSTERAGVERAQFWADIDQVTEDLTAIAAIAHSAATIARRNLGRRLPPEGTDERPRCSSFGLEGNHLVWVKGDTDLDDGWADPECSDLPRNGTSGLCDRCRIRFGRWRRRHGLPALADEQPAA